MDNVENNQAPAEGQNNEGNPRSYKNFKDIQLEFLSGGLETIRAFVDAGEVSAAVVARAARELEGHGGVSADAYNGLVQYVEEITATPANGSRRGKQPPQVGETRTYKAQVTKSSPTPFLRLPLSNLGVSKAEEVQVTFEDGRTIVTRVG